MKTNNQPKLKNKIFIIWGLFISGVILVFLIILLLSIKSQSKTDNQNQPTLTSKTNSQQEQETYNRLMNKIEKEINELTNKEEIVYHLDGKTINYIKILDSQTKKEIKRKFYQPNGEKLSKLEEYDLQGNLIKRIVYFDDGENIKWIKEYDPKTNLQIKNTIHNKQGKIIQIIKNKPSKDYIVEEYDPQTGKKIEETYYNSDGTIKEIKTCPHNE